MAAAGEFSGAALAHLTPRPTQILTNDNYIPVDQLGFTQQYLPDVYEKEVERYGNRTVSGFLRMVGAEMPMTSDVVTWFEQGRLHIAYENVAYSGANQLTLDIANDLECLIIPGHTIAIADVDGLNVVKAYVTAVNAATGVIDLKVYGATALPTAWAGGGTPLENLKLFVYGSEYAKGSQNAGKFVEAKGDFFSNKPIILREKYSVSGSNTAQIGWIEVTTEIGTSGYLWYLKSEHEARIRFEDQLEMAMIEAEPNTTGTAPNLTITPFDQAAGYNGGAASGTEVSGSEGLFYAIENRGLVYTDADFGAAPGSAGGLDDFDSILQELDRQGAIEENMLFLNRATSLGIDKMLAYQNSYGAGGTSYGVFENNENMALNLGFSGFRRGSYDFYKTDWKYLNNPTTRGLFNDVEGVLVPAGVSTVYDQQLGTNIQRPFLHTRYRASEADDRRMKSWITGSVGGNYTSDEDAMNVHFLSERALCVQGANNFVMLKKATA